MAVSYKIAVFLHMKVKTDFGMFSSTYYHIKLTVI